MAAILLLDSSSSECPLPSNLSQYRKEHEVEKAFNDIAANTYPDMHEIIPGIWLGNQRAAGIFFPFEIRENPALRQVCLTSLITRRISLIICCCGVGEIFRPFEDSGIMYIDEHLEDRDPKDILATSVQVGPLLERALPLVRMAIERGEGVLIHCNSGIHRSSSIVCGLLMVLQGLTLERAYQVTLKRAVAYPIFWPYLQSKEFTAVTKTMYNKTDKVLPDLSNLLRVLVGSTNPVKVEAVRTAFQTAFPNKTIEIKTFPAPSGVSDQPMVYS